MRQDRINSLLLSQTRIIHLTQFIKENCFYYVARFRVHYFIYYSTVLPDGWKTSDPVYYAYVNTFSLCYWKCKQLQTCFGTVLTAFKWKAKGADDLLKRTKLEIICCWYVKRSGSGSKKQCVCNNWCWLLQLVWQRNENANVWDVLLLIVWSWYAQREHSKPIQVFFLLRKIILIAIENAKFL